MIRALSTLMLILLVGVPANAKYIGSDPPKCTGCACSGCTRPSNEQHSNSSSSLSRTMSAA